MVAGKKSINQYVGDNFVIFQFILQQIGRMREEKQNLEALEILCIGQIQAGKSYFLNKYTKDQFKETLNSSYAIFAKKLHSKFIIFHELSEEEELYLEKQYDGVLFFVDLAGAWNVTENILKWMEIQSRLTGVNIFKIPLRVIITKSKPHNNAEKWRRQLQKQLSSLINKDQIIYFQDLQSVEVLLEHYFDQITEGKASGIKSTHQNNFRLYGFSHFYKLFSTNAKLTFFRNVEVVQKYVRARIGFFMKTKSI